MTNVFNVAKVAKRKLAVIILTSASPNKADINITVLNNKTIASLTHHKEIHLTFSAALESYDQLALRSKGLILG